MVECTPLTVNSAVRWLRGIETRPGCNLKTAVKMAFDNENCNAVYLVSLVETTFFVNCMKILGLIKRITIETNQYLKQMCYMIRNFKI